MPNIWKYLSSPKAELFKFPDANEMIPNEPEEPQEPEWQEEIPPVPEEEKEEEPLNPVSFAQLQADTIVQDAKRQAEEILARAREEAEKLAEENQLLRARLLGQKALEGGVTAEELDSMTDRDSFENLERELEAFVGLYERVWKQTKRKIRKDLLNLKYIKGQSGKQ